MLRTLSLIVALTSLASADPAPVVGGTTPSRAWPDVVAVMLADGVCTGTLVAPDVVVTAAHCVDREPRLVITNTADYARGGDRIAVKWARSYPEWWARFDIGVVVLERPARGRPRAVAAACLANARLRAAEPVRIVGFGATTPDGTDDNHRLHEATVPILDPYCTTDAGCFAGAQPKGEFSAGGRGSDACFGDSGGPAFIDTADGPALIGIVSRGLALPGIPCGNGSIYVRADKVVSWIQSVTDRRLLRASCDGPGDEPAEDEEGGCAAAGGGGGALVLLAIASLRRRATRRVRPRPD